MTHAQDSKTQEFRLMLPQSKLLKTDFHTKPTTIMNLNDDHSNPQRVNSAILNCICDQENLKKVIFFSKYINILCVHNLICE